MKRGRPIRALAALALIVPLAACSGLNTQQQRTLSGGALGAAVGAFTHDDQVKVNP